MRLWHKELIPYLDKQRLVAQWRECCCIAKNIADNGTPNHLLVNEVLNYPSIHFVTYTNMVLNEMQKRGYKINEKACSNFYKNIQKGQHYFHDKWTYPTVEYDNVFPSWHNDRYLIQCLFNLQEKADRQGITSVDWYKIYHNFERYINGIYNRY